MFKYDDRIFNEIHEVDLDPMANEYFMENVYPQNFMENVYPQIVEKEDDDPICVWSINKNSILWHALIVWYKDENPLDHIRSAVEDDDTIYFATGAGYDIISSDLLDGQPDGKAKQEFLDLLNK